MSRSIAIIGAGITGVTSACKLMEQGYDVTLFDRQRYAGMETSFANGGQLSASNSEVWNRWSTVLKGLKWMFQPDAPLSMSPLPNWHRITWMAEFIASIRNYETNTIKTAEMAIAARKHLFSMAETYGVDFDQSSCGILHFYQDKAEFSHAQRVTALLARAGLEREELTPDQIIEKESTLSGSFVGGFWTPSDSTGDIHKFTFRLANALESNGVKFELGQDISGVSNRDTGVVITTQDGKTAQFDKLLICAGSGSRALARQLGDRINVYPVKGYSITVELEDVASRNGAPTISLLDDQAKIVTSRLGQDRFRIAGTAEFNGFNRDIRHDRVAPLTAWCERHFPNISTEQVVPWSGLRPMMPDMMPRVTQGRNPRVFYNTGHGHLGWTLSAVTAEMITAKIVASDASAKTRYASAAIPPIPTGAQSRPALL